MAIPKRPQNITNKAKPVVNTPVDNGDFVLPPLEAYTEAALKAQQDPKTESDDPEWRIDPVTKKRYKVLPKTEWLPNEPGHSKVHMTEVDALDDLNTAADTYLAHLRVAPSKEEQEALLRERARKKAMQDQQFNNEHSNDDNNFNDLGYKIGE